MRTNPFSDALGFLTQARWTTGAYWILLLASILAAWVSWRRDPAQRSAAHFWTWVARFSIGTMWWTQTLWKLPPTYTDRPGGGLPFWIGEVVKYSAFRFQRDALTGVVLPHFSLFAPLIYLAEVLVAVTLMVGVLTRLGAFIGLLQAINLWLGLYRDPHEWPWTYVFMIIIQLLFVVYPPGRSLGIDAIMRGRAATPRSITGPASR